MVKVDFFYFFYLCMHMLGGMASEVGLEQAPLTPTLTYSHGGSSFYFKYLFIVDVCVCVFACVRREEENALR